jgi:hypothetical protein
LINNLTGGAGESMDNTGKRRELTEKDRYKIEKCMKRGFNSYSSWSKHKDD